MKLKKINRERKQVLYFTDSKGIRRPALVYFDDLHNAKKPPAWMQDILFNNSMEEEREKGA